MWQQMLEHTTATKFTRRLPSAFSRPLCLAGYVRGPGFRVAGSSITYLGTGHAQATSYVATLEHRALDRRACGEACVAPIGG